jgi:hypothetical protein
MPFLPIGDFRVEPIFLRIVRRIRVDHNIYVIPARDMI